MKKKIRVEISSMKKADCFRLSPKGPIYVKDSSGDYAVGITGCRTGCVIRTYKNRLVYPVNVKIVEVK